MNEVKFKTICSIKLKIKYIKIWQLYYVICRKKDKSDRAMLLFL